MEMTPENVPEIITDALGIEGAIVICVLPHDCIQVLSTANLNHAKATQMLALAIHAVLSDHDTRVLAGEAGEAARDLFEGLANGDPLQ